MMRRTPGSTLCPDTTLFRSFTKILQHHGQIGLNTADVWMTRLEPLLVRGECVAQQIASFLQFTKILLHDAQTRLNEREGIVTRSEEHTSELQSRQYLVCRLL